LNFYFKHGFFFTAAASGFQEGQLKTG
jgi:hypothetical protein